MLKCRDIAETGLPDELSRGRRMAFYMHRVMCRHCRRFLRHLRLARDVAARIGGEQLRVDAPAEAVFQQLRSAQHTDPADGRPE